MPDDFAPDLGGLAAEYTTLTELRRAPRTRTYLARHAGFNREVVITVIAPLSSGETQSLAVFAADARSLSAMRHAGITRVIEARWLADGSLAVVRARVHGATLDDIIRRGESFPLPRVAEVLDQAGTALAWARDNGIVNRMVSGRAVVLQRGSGRLLLELEMSFGGGDEPTDAYDDARTIEQLAYAMLVGRPVGEAASAPLAELRPDLSRAIIHELSMLAEADRARAPRDPGILIGLLRDVPPPEPTPEVKQVPTIVAASPVRPARRSADGQSFGFAGRLAILAVVSTALGAAGALLLRHGPASPRRPEPIAARVAAGDVARDTAAGVPRLTAAPPGPAKPDTQRAVAVIPSAQPRRAAAPRRDSSAPRVRAAAVEAPPDSGMDACDSPEAEDQHACFASEIARSDSELTAVYRQLLDALRSAAHAIPGLPDPASVDSVRSAHRSWLDAREAACRLAGDVPLYAIGRSQCYAARAALRTKELRERLTAVTSPP